MTKTVTINQFKTFLTRNDWQRQQFLEILDTEDHQGYEFDDDLEIVLTIERTRVFGATSLVSTLDGIVIRYNEGFSYYQYQPETLISTTDGMDAIWEIEGVRVVDEDGEELTANELDEYLDYDFSRIDYDELNIEQIIEIDYQEDSDMETFTIEVDNEPSIRFTGELLATASSKDNDSVGRWTELRLYRTQGGKHICYQVGRTQWEGERDRFDAKVCDSIEEVKEYFGHKWLAKELYADAGIEDVVEVD